MEGRGRGDRSGGVSRGGTIQRMRFGVNSVLFGGYPMEVAFKWIAAAGYDGIEISAIDGMSEHLVLSQWREYAPEISKLSREYGLELLAMEQPSQDPAVMESA